MDEGHETSNLFTTILVTIGFIIGTYIMFNFIFGINCHVEGALSKDKYCAEITSNYTYGFEGYEVKSHKQDLIDQANREEQYRINAENERNRLACYDAGYDVNLTFDPIADYNLSCKKLDYINDHLTDYVVDGGYIKGRYSGFLSGGYVEGHFNIIKRGLFEDRLTKNVYYHVDCNNQTSNEKIDYYDEKEFIRYYLDSCLK